MFHKKKRKNRFSAIIARAVLPVFTTARRRPFICVLKEAESVFATRRSVCRILLTLIIRDEKMGGSDEETDSAHEAAQR
jgi:hypothetical protein